MSTDLSELTADELAARTREWLADHLPSGWMEAVDAYLLRGQLPAEGTVCRG